MILVFGGTGETHDICNFMRENHISFRLSIATEYGRSTFDEFKENMQVSRLEEADIYALIREIHAEIILDLTHPYAANISNNAISAAKKANILYIRYERHSLWATDNDIYEVSSHEEALSLAESLGKKPFLAVGSNNAHIYAQSQKFTQLFIRLLPKSELIKKCEDLGYDYGSIIGMQGPFSKEMNKQMLLSTKADVMISKESGNAGGFLEKFQACKELGIPLIVIARPKIDYPNVYKNLDEIKELLLNRGGEVEIFSRGINL